MVRTLLCDIYCLEIREIVLLVAIGTYGFLWLDKKLCPFRIWRWGKCGIVLALLAAIAYTTLANRSGGGNLAHAFMPFHSYREVWNGGNPEIYRSNFMNVVLFYPAGLLAASLLPRKWPGWCRCLLVVLVLTAMSAGIEFLQYRYALGRCEIDDVIHNSLGALLGCMAALLVPRCLYYLGEKIKSK